MKEPSASRASSHHDTQADAQRIGRGYLGNERGGELIRQERHGRIRDGNSFIGASLVEMPLGEIVKPRTLRHDTGSLWGSIIPPADDQSPLAADSRKLLSKCLV